MSETILVTGGSGFIGRNLLETLGERWRLLAPPHGELELLDDGQVARYLESHDVGVVVHCAVRPGHRNAADPSAQLERNLRMFANLARCRDSYRRLIFVSSGAVYDQRHSRPRLPETAFGEHVPVDEHGFSKYLCAAYAATRPDIVELRPFGVFGPYEDYAIRFISNAICKTLADLPVTLRQDRRFDYTPVGDLARVIERFFTHDPRHGAYNVSAPETWRLLELAHLVVRLSGKDVPVVVANEGMGAEYSGDGARLRDELPDLEHTPIELAVARLYDWYALRRDAIDRDALLVDR
ncbi:MAG TPA: NAD(P)-dependent oxidoreductase [Thermoleophilia bacterium]|nr:NAD(P)-dependent oxidoreductase [Thermoleophilia bacterium]